MKRKQWLSVLLALAICFGCSAGSFAYERETQHTPVILVPGYSSSPLYLNYGKADEKQVWGLDMDEVMAAILSNIAQIGIGLGELTLGKVDRLVDTVGPEAMKIMEHLKFNADGSSAYDLTTGYTKPEESNNAWLTENRDGEFITEPDIMGGIGEIIGTANVFNFYCDFRQGAAECAKALRVYVEAVKKYTGSDKVSLCAISHGGQVVGTYLSLYGTLGDLDNVMMSVPALGGAMFAYDALSLNVQLDEKLLVYYIECGFMSETSFEWLLHACELGVLDVLLNKLLEGYIAPIAMYWGSIWDFIPTEHYEEMKERWLDTKESAAIIKASDYMHYEIMPNYGKAFRAAQKAGVNVSIMSNTGAPAVTGSAVNSDAIIPTAGSSGALCAPYGERFADGYTGTGKACTDPAHWHISPSMEIDATHAYLPENTWFIEGQFHGMSFWDTYTKTLLRKLLLTDDLPDIYADPQYPQFGRTHNAKDAVYIEFDQSPQGYVTAKDSALRIYNLSAKYPIKITSVECEGMKLKFDTRGLRTVAPGGMTELTFSGTIPDAHAKRASITVHVMQLGALSAVASRTFDYTILGGAAIAYNSNAPYAPADFVNSYGKHTYYVIEWLVSFWGMRNWFDDFAAVISSIAANI